ARGIAFGGLERRGRISGRDEQTLALAALAGGRFGAAADRTAPSVYLATTGLDGPNFVFRFHHRLHDSAVAAGRLHQLEGVAIGDAGRQQRAHAAGGLEEDLSLRSVAGAALSLLDR